MLRSFPGRGVVLGILAALALGGLDARAQDDRDYMRIIGIPETVGYAADIATALNKAAFRKFPQIEQSSDEGAQRAFCATLRDSPDLMIIPLPLDRGVDKICSQKDFLLALPFGRQVLTLYTAPGGPKLWLTRDQLFRAVARQLPRGGGGDTEERGFEPNPNKRWRDVSPDLPDLPIRIIGPPQRAIQWLTFEDLLMRPACLAIPSVAALAKIDENVVESHCLGRRTDRAIVYAEGATYNANPRIVPVGNELAINERHAMQLMPDAVPQAIDSVLPDNEALDANRYSMARPIVAVVKAKRLDSIPNLRDFITELLSPAASGPKGYLVRDGMDGLSETALRDSTLKVQFAHP